MDNENKELQNGLNEAELEEKVRQDVSEKIRDAAAEVEDEIAEAAAAAEETAEEEITEETVEEDFSENAEGDLSEGFWNGEEGEDGPARSQSKMVNMKKTNLILTVAGAVVAGALVLFLAMSIPKWVAKDEKAPADKKGALKDSVLLEDAENPLEVKTTGEVVAEVNGIAISDEDLKFYICMEAQNYINENGGLISDPTLFDWGTEVAEGKTAEDIVKEKALRAAIENVLLIEAGKNQGVEWNQEMEAAYVEGQVYMMIKTYGEDLIKMNVLRQGYSNLDQYKRLMIRESYAADIAKDLTANPGNYYPDMDALAPYVSTDGVTVKHILVMADTTAPEEVAVPEEEVPAEEEAAEAETDAVDKRILAEEILKKAREGEDFDALVREFNEDEGMPSTGYFVDETASFVPEFKDAALALAMDEVSEIVETEYGYHIIKRVPGEVDLFNYWRGVASISQKDDLIGNISVADVVNQVAKDEEEFNRLYQEYMSNNLSMGY